MINDIFSSSLVEKEYLDLLHDTKIKVISFDIFDTLFFRKCGVPTNVFEIMGEHAEVEKRFDSPSTFSQYRQHAEKGARKVLSHKKDITLEEIYAQLPLTSKEQKRFQEIELEIESQMLVLNPQLERWIKFALDANKQIILISDMYLNTAQVQVSALNKLREYGKILKIYMSNECNATKSTGTLFEYVLRDLDLKPRELLHIGDNQRSDISIANNYEINTLYYGCHQEQKKRLMHENVYMQDSFRKGADTRHLASLLNPYKDELQKFYFDIGTSIFAPVLWEFSHWMAEIVTRFEIEKLHFIMREGAIFQKCFASLYPTMATSLLYASRKSTQFLTLDAHDIGSINFSLYKKFSIKDLYDNLFIEMTNDTIKNYAQTQCSQADNIELEGGSLLDLVTSDIQQKIDILQSTLEQKKNLLLDYLKSSELDNKSTLIDFGGTGTVIKRLMEFLPQHIRPSSGILFYEHAQGYAKLYDKNILSFLPLTKKTAKAVESIHRTPEFLEILLNGTHETSIDYNLQDNKVFVSTYLPRTNSTNITTITTAFHKGIDSFFELAKANQLPKESYSRENLALLLARLIELPTAQEAQLLGSLEYDEGKASGSSYTLLTDSMLSSIELQGVSKIHRNFLANPLRNRHQAPWMEGIITLHDPAYLLQFYDFSINPNQEVIDRIINELENSKNKKIMVYGAGELFVQLLPYLKDRGIEIEALIDSRAEVKNFEIEGYKVLSLTQAIKNKESANIVIASGAFSIQIEQYLQDFAKNFAKKIQIFKG